MGLKWHVGEEMTEFGVNYTFKCTRSLSALHLGYLENAFWWPSLLFKETLWFNDTESCQWELWRLTIAKQNKV